jgi:sulfur transfer protein SufE
MIINSKLKEYKSNIESIQAIDSLEVYKWLISLGKKLDEDPLSKKKCTEKNRVSRCQFDLFVDWEDNKFKARSNAMVAGGYAYVLLDIFNSSPIHEAKKITADHFKKIKMDELLTMNRKTGFYQMIEMMMRRIKNVRN